MIIVFDTNAYRDLGAGKNIEEAKALMNDILAKESAMGYKAFMCTTVAMELMYHLQDNRLWNSFRSCIKAAPIMYLHCGDAQSFRMLPLPEVQVAKVFYNIEIASSIATQQTIGQIFYALTQGDPSKVVLNYPAEITKAHQFIVDAEQTLAVEMDNLLTYFDPNYKHDWNPFVNDESNRRKYLNDIDSDEFEITTAKAFIIAVGMLLQSKNYIKIVPEYKNLDKEAEVYRLQYGASLLFRRRFFNHLAGGGFDITKNSRANYLWDEYILHFAGQSVNGEPILLVTTDGNMKQAALDYNQAIPIMTLIEYLNHLGI